MKAWQFTTTNEPLVLADIPDPVPGPGEVVLDIKAAGLCHSDVGAMTDPSWLAIIPNRPIVIGHEIAGVVTSIGEGVDGVRVGDRVGVCPTASASAPGYGRDGGFTFKHRTPAGDLVPMPDGLTFELAALGTDAGAPQITVDTMDVILKQAQVYGSNGGTKEDVAAVYELLASGDVQPVVSVVGFDDIPRALDDLREHRVVGRVVAHLAD